LTGEVSVVRTVEQFSFQAASTNVQHVVVVVVVVIIIIMITIK